MRAIQQQIEGTFNHQRQWVEDKRGRANADAGH
jgi:hypothetical protein